MPNVSDSAPGELPARGRSTDVYDAGDRGLVVERAIHRLVARRA